MKKSDVNGENALPVYAFLKEKAPYVAPKGLKAKMAALAFKAGAKDSKGENDVKWNFTKFVVDREGNVIARYEPTYDMKKFSEEISKLF
jgi:glutathione peroxidase